jgi:hypothetical protein
MRLSSIMRIDALRCALPTGADYGQAAVLGLAASDAAELAELVSDMTSGAGVVVPIGDEWVNVEPR